MVYHRANMARKVFSENALLGSPRYMTMSAKLLRD